MTGWFWQAEKLLEEDKNFFFFLRGDWIEERESRFHRDWTELRHLEQHSHGFISISSSSPLFIHSLAVPRDHTHTDTCGREKPLCEAPFGIDYWLRNLFSSPWPLRGGGGTKIPPQTSWIDDRLLIIKKTMPKAKLYPFSYYLLSTTWKKGHPIVVKRTNVSPSTDKTVHVYL